MHPVTGPLIQTYGGSGNSDAYLYRTRYKQARPYNLVLPYEFRTGTVAMRTSRYADRGAYDTWTGYSLQEHCDRFGLTNKAYERFRSKVSDRAELGVAVLEIEKSWKMIADRAVQLSRFVRQLRRGNLSGAAATLRTPVPRGASLKKDFAGNFLEYSFGWVPTIMDIGNAIDVLQSPIKSPWVRGSASSREEVVFGAVNTDNPIAVYPDATYSEQKHGFRKGTRITAATGASISVSNPNLWLANQLGFVNPASVIWELIPFSFVVDWFVNVGDIIASFTDFYGLTLSSAWTSYSMSGAYYSYYEWKSRYAEIDYSTTPPSVTWHPMQGEDDLTINVASVSRSQGLISPVLLAPSLQAFGKKQAAYSVALLIQLFGR